MIKKISLATSLTQLLVFFSNFSFSWGAEPTFYEPAAQKVYNYLQKEDIESFWEELILQMEAKAKVLKCQRSLPQAGWTIITMARNGHAIDHCREEAYLEVRVFQQKHPGDAKINDAIIKIIRGDITNKEDQETMTSFIESKLKSRGYEIPSIVKEQQ